METKKILVTGGNGQLDKAFRNFQKISRIWIHFYRFRNFGYYQ
jgi:dTDP-4-dehydrorhamnose reductase